MLANYYQGSWRRKGFTLCFTGETKAGSHFLLLALLTSSITSRTSVWSLGGCSSTEELQGVSSACSQGLRKMPVHGLLSCLMMRNLDIESKQVSADSPVIWLLMFETNWIAIQVDLNPNHQFPGPLV